MIGLCLIGGVLLFWLPAADVQKAEVRARLFTVLHYRPVEGRLVGAYPYRSYRKISLPPDLARQLIPVVRTAVRRSIDDHSASGRADLAVIDLFGNKSASAVRRLALAVAEGGLGHPDLLADLATAYIARSAEEKRPLDLVRALAVAQKAVNAAPGHPAALFNRALALERLHLDRASREAWNAYLNLEHDPQWRAEAYEHLGHLESRQIETTFWSTEMLKWREEEVFQHAAASPGIAREYVEKQLLGDWAADVTAGRWDDASHKLSIAQMVGKSLARWGGDYLIADLVLLIEHSKDHPEPLARAYSSYLEGIQAYEDFDISKARQRLNQARSLLPAGVGNPLWFGIESALSGCDYQESLYASMIARVDSLLKLAYQGADRGSKLGLSAPHLRSRTILSVRRR